MARGSRATRRRLVANAALSKMKMPMSDAVTLRSLSASDLPAVAALHSTVFGPGRFARTAYRVREQCGAVSGLVSPFCGVAVSGNHLIASVTFTPICVGTHNGVLLLGPLAVHPDYAGLGYGRSLVAQSIEAARSAGIKAIILVGDVPYYGRFGFKAVPPGQIAFPGPVDQNRILCLELLDGALVQLRGAVTAT